MKRIKSEYPLADIFNFVLGKLSVLESISKPVTFSSRDNALPALYYDVVLYGKYMALIYKRTPKIKSIVDYN